MQYFLFEPKVVPKGYDFVCFTDNEDFESDVWDVRKVKSLYTDSARDAKRYKTLPHRYLKEYDESIWVDVDVKIQKDPSELEGESILKVHASGICGSDMHAYHGKDERRIPPLILGHEVSGQVQNGKYCTVYPFELAVCELNHPMPTWAEK